MIPPELVTLRDFLRWAVSRFNEVGLHFGHGTQNAYDEAAYLLLHALHLPLDRMEPFLDAALTESERKTVFAILNRRIDERIPAAYLTHEAWLGDFPFYVDERVIVPRSHIAELLLDDPLAPGSAIPMRLSRRSICAPARAAWPSSWRMPFRTPASMPRTSQRMPWRLPHETWPSISWATASS